MTKFKKIMSVMMAVFLLIGSISLKTYANENEKFGSLYEGKEIVGVYCTEGEIFYLDEKELEEIKFNDSADIGMERMSDQGLTSREMGTKSAGIWTSTNKVSEGSPYLDYSKQRAVSPSVKGPGTITSGHSETFSYSASMSLTGAERSVIGGSWSVSTSSSFSVSFRVPSGKMGYVAFTPKYKKIKAERITYVDATIVDRETINIYQPVKVGRYADGLYELVTY